MRKHIVKIEILSFMILGSTLISAMATRPLIQNDTKRTKCDSVLSIGNESVDSLFTRSARKVPQDYSIGVGFYSFAKVDDKVLWRSGQPLINEFKWLKDEGCKSIIDLRINKEYNEVTIDSLVTGFKETGLLFFSIPIDDGQVPSEEQAISFLKLIQKPEIQPALIHCRSGVGRTSLMAALYRYSVQGWSMRKAIQESRNFKNGVNAAQYDFLCRWAEIYPPGSFKI
jgi:protein tyrosine phosphatase (PTP) superfamily phosphohydrolase (DUF442 family)